MCFDWVILREVKSQVSVILSDQTAHPVFDTPKIARNQEDVLVFFMHLTNPNCLSRSDVRIEPQRELHYATPVSFVNPGIMKGRFLSNSCRAVR